MQSRMSSEAGSRLDGAGSANGQEHRRIVESSKNEIEMKWSLAKPADVRPDFAVAGAQRKFGRGFVELRVVKRPPRTGIAAAFEELSVHVNDARGASLFVEIVDILRAEEQTAGERLLEIGKGEMGGIGFGSRSNAAAHRVEVPDQTRIAVPGLWRGNIFEAVVAPEATGIAKRGDSTFRAHAGARQNENVVRA